jgi:lycopene cyclase domain-containing protein
MEYLLILVVFLVSAIFMEWRYHLHIYHTLRGRFIITGIFFLIGITWDYFATWRGHWSFQGPGLIGIRIGLLPIEEFLFVLIIPFWIVTLYKVLDEKLKLR